MTVRELLDELIKSVARGESEAQVRVLAESSDTSMLTDVMSVDSENWKDELLIRASKGQ